MDTGYDEFCLADPDFYDSPVRTRGDDIDFATGPPLDLDGWTTTELEDWLAYTPAGAVLPSQGWKVHVSACQDNAAEILAIVCGFCLPRRIAFKFVRSQQLLLLSNSKYANRGSSGKFVTIYPADETELEAVLTELGASLQGRSGPYILSDLRWGPGPLYVRYGGFVEQYCVAPNGRLEMAIADADGNLVPDVRGPMFSVPPWVTLPAILEPHLEARRRATVADLPYSIEAAIHFSNGGGVYTGTDQRSGDQVILKEARPHAGLSTDGEDAVARLRRERDTLRLLAGLDVVPGLKDSFTVGGHEFLVLARVEGIPLDAALVERYPLSLHEIDRAAVTDYTTWAIDMLGRLEAAVAAIHQREVVIGDLHPNNVIITADGRVVLIDFEVASHVDERRRPPLGDPGFTAPHTFTGFDIDRYALACMRLFVFLPLTALFGLDRTKAEQLAAAITELFPVPADFLAEAVRTVVGPPAAAKPSHPWRLEPDPDGWLRAGASMADAILASATPNRDDRLFPGDIAQFQTGGLNLAYGAAGVLYALDATGHTAPDEYTEWLAHRAINPEPGTRLGFYDGLHGVAHVLDVLGRGSEALKVLDICAGELQQRWDRLGLDLQGGLAGVALNLAHFAAATGDPSLWDDVWRVAEAVADRLGDETSVATISGGDLPYAGLLRGSSGPALMFLRLYEHRADEALLDLAATALRQDLRRCVPTQDGTLEVDEGWRTMP